MSLTYLLDLDSPLASRYQGRPVTEDRGCAIALDRVAALVQNCVDKHEDCKPSSLPLPSRLLDLEGCKDPKEIKLQDTGGANGHYAALSHCWGCKGQFTTSHASIAARKEGIKIEGLSRTFRDAVEIVRRMGIRYLWIDSLSILQDDAEEWACESANMAAVYSNSYLTVAAAHAKDGSGRFFQSSRLETGDPS
jgi:hypothetical protein